MGEKGSKLTQKATDVCEQVVRDLAPMGEVTQRKMFGGYGIFESSAMFALVDPQGEVYLKANDSNRARFENTGAERHGRMPYFKVPMEVLGDADLLRDWAEDSIAVAHVSRKK